MFLSAFLRDRKLTDNQAKQLALLEVCRQDDKPVRLDIIERLIGYIGKADKELAKERIKKLIKWDKKQA